MALLQNPSEITESIYLAGLFYGQPGVGKSTLALSAPNPVMIDADQGMERVQKRFQVPSLPLTDYSLLLELLGSSEIDPFETIVFDTLGRLVERIGDYITSNNPSYRQKDGSLSLKGFGQLRMEFQRLLRLARDKRKHLIFVAHDREDRDGDTRTVRPDTGPGSSGKDLVKDLGFMGYMEMRGDQRTISFTPCERYYAKNSLGLDSIIRIPDIADGNTFVRDVIIARAKARAEADRLENEKYTALLASLNEVIADVTDPKSADDALYLIRRTPVIWDSQRVARRKLADRIGEVGLVFNRDAGKFELAPAPKPEPEQTEEPGEAAKATADPAAAQSNGHVAEPAQDDPVFAPEPASSSAVPRQTPDRPMVPRQTLEHPMVPRQTLEHPMVPRAVK